MSRAELVLIGLAGRGQVFEFGSGTNTRRLTTSVLERIRILGIYTDGRIPDPKELKLMERQGVTGSETAKGTQSRSTRQALDTIDDIAVDGLAGMPQAYLNALEWAILGNVEAYDRLFRKLHRVGLRSRSDGDIKNLWPEKLRRQKSRFERAPAEDYLSDLVTMALLELAKPQRFSTHSRRAEWFGLSVQHWKTTMRQPYGLLSNRSNHYFESAIDHIERRLRRRARETRNE